MRKTLTALTAATTIAVTLAATSTDASAQWRRWGWGPGAFIGGLAAGAIVASAFARPYYYGYGGYYNNYYYPAYSYDYYAPAPVTYSYYPAYNYYPGAYGCWRGGYRVC